MAVEKTTLAEHKKKKARSPNFPATTLKDALALAEKVYKAENLGWAPAHVVVTEHWGFGAKSSAWKLRLAAVSAYGLLAARGEGALKEVCVSELAKAILLDRVPGSVERKHALATAALRPAIHKELREKYGAQLQSDATVLTYLVRDRGFTDSGAESALETYKAAIAYAGLDANDSMDTPSDEPETKGSWGDRIERAPQQPPHRVSGASNMRELPITLPSLSVAVLKIPQPMTATDFDFLSNTLAALKAALTAAPAAQGGP